jgi:hypothetical protein
MTSEAAQPAIRAKIFFERERMVATETEDGPGTFPA